uniref:Ss18, like 2 n=1 Tax=Salmo trutta TaxID=8032 RepID=A0A673Y3Z6_SALTR
MSVAFVPKRHRGKAQINQETIQRLLDENDQLVRCITEYMQKGRAMECVQYQQILHRNIVYLGTIADASQTWQHWHPQTSNLTFWAFKYSP